jgi:hypothetical protein
MRIQDAWIPDNHEFTLYVVHKSCYRSVFHTTRVVFVKIEAPKGDQMEEDEMGWPTWGGDEKCLQNIGRPKSPDPFYRMASPKLMDVRYCGLFTQTVAKQRLRKHISTEKLLSIRSALWTLLRRSKHISALLRNSAVIGRHTTMRDAWEVFCTVGAEFI